MKKAKSKKNNHQVESNYDPFENNDADYIAIEKLPTNEPITETMSYQNSEEYKGKE